MLVKKSFLFYILLIIFVIITLCIAVYILNDRLSEKHISIKNESKIFSLSYKRDSKLEKLLQEWRFWEAERLRINGESMSEGAKKIQVILTDTPQTFYAIQEKKELITGAKVIVERNTFIIYVYLSPKIKTLKLSSTYKNRNDYYSGLVSWEVLDTLYTATHASPSFSEKNKTISKIIQQIYGSTQKMPFKIKPI